MRRCQTEECHADQHVSKHVSKEM